MPNQNKPPPRSEHVSSSRITDSASKPDILNLARANKILAALPADDLESIATKLEVIDFNIDMAFHRVQDPIKHVYFPTEGIVSLVTLLEDGTTVEVGVIGREGMVGISAIMGAKTEPNEALAQSDGRALRMPAADLQVHFNNGNALRGVLLRYAHNLLTLVSQNAACNRAHTVEQRLARWLLLTHDRLINDQFIFTQEFMSRMLGVRRAGVSVAANTLRQAGLIAYSRGSITILDRAGLEVAACECYAIINSQAL